MQVGICRQVKGANAVTEHTAMAWQQKNDPDSVLPWFLRDAAATAIIPELAPPAVEAALR